MTVVVTGAELAAALGAATPGAIAMGLTMDAPTETGLILKKGRGTRVRCKKCWQLNNFVQHFYRKRSHAHAPLVDWAAADAGENEEAD